MFQASRGWLDSPEELEPGQDLTRTTASALFSRTRPHGQVVAALVLGRNEEEDGHQGSIGLEGTYTFADKNHVFGRIERVDRTGLIDVSDPDSPPEVTVQAWTLGAGRDLGRVFTLPVTLGAAFTFYRKPDMLDPVYGDNPTSFYMYLRLRAPRMTMEHGATRSHVGH